MNAEARLEKLVKWKAIIDEANQSGIGIRRWCMENKIMASQYYYWHKILVDKGLIPERKSTVPSVPNNPSSAELVPVFAEFDLQQRQMSPMEEHSFSASHILETQIVIQRNSCQIFVGEGFSSSALQRVLEVIGNAS